jgi:hypothetical protein
VIRSEDEAVPLVGCEVTANDLVGALDPEILEVHAEFGRQQQARLRECIEAGLEIDATEINNAAEQAARDIVGRTRWERFHREMRRQATTTAKRLAKNPDYLVNKVGRLPEMQAPAGDITNDFEDCDWIVEGVAQAC